MRVKRGQLNSVMEFDHVIRVHKDGTVTDVPNVYAPEVYMDTDLSIVITDGWSLLDGYSGQYLYSGPVMHPSEFIGGGLERDILAEPGVYVAVVVTAIEDDSDDNIAGWAIAQRMNGDY